MISTGPIEDRLMIRELVESYNDAVMRFDADAWGANWTEDAVWNLPGAGDMTPKKTIVAAWQQAMSAFSFVGFFASAGPITVAGETATGTWYQQEFLHQKDGVKRTVTGKYTDSYVKQNGRWLFAKRIYEILDAQQSDS